MCTTRVGKKLINSLETCVDDFVNGFIFTHPNLQLMDGHRIVFRRDFEIGETPHVVVIGGGASGHEPAEIGFVGRGMLTAAVIGDLFKPPPIDSILAAIRTFYNPAGVLLISKNNKEEYSHFLRAYQILKDEQLNINLLKVTDDVSETSTNKRSDRRGICGAILAYKIGGSMADNYYDLVEITTCIGQFLHYMGTMALSYTALSLPGQKPTFPISNDSMVLGPGLEGESGFRKVPVANARKTVRMVIDHMFNRKTQIHIPIDKAERLAVMFNNLGGLSLLELCIVVKESLDYLKELEYNVDRCYFGTFMTSFDMVGFSITISCLYEGGLPVFDASTNAPYWIIQAFPPPVPEEFVRVPRPHNWIEVCESPSSDVDSLLLPFPAPMFDRDLTNRMHRLLQRVARDLIAAEDHLNSLDIHGGDGDCGTNMAKFGREILEELATPESTRLPTCCPKKLLIALAVMADKVIGGTSGALYAVFFTAAASSLSNGVAIEDWCAALQNGTEAVARYGVVDPGERTMVDPLNAACTVLFEQITKTTPIQAFTEAVRAADVAAEATSRMAAKTGRASFFNSALLTQPDPGAVVVITWLHSILSSLTNS